MPTPKGDPGAANYDEDVVRTDSIRPPAIIWPKIGTPLSVNKMTGRLVTIVVFRHRDAAWSRFVVAPEYRSRSSAAARTASTAFVPKAVSRDRRAPAAPLCAQVARSQISA